MPISTHAGVRPTWLVDSLGSLGVPFSRVEDFAPPPESSHGALFLEGRLKNGYHSEEIADGVYWVTSGCYDCMFIRTGSGVIAVDAPPALGNSF